jgi:glucose/mannose transport system substrate-binding protein
MEVASGNGSLLPSYAHGMVLRGAQAGAITDVVTNHFNSDMKSSDAVKALVAAVKDSL